MPFLIKNKHKLFVNNYFVLKENAPPLFYNNNTE